MRIVIDAPVTLFICAICIIVFGLDKLQSDFIAREFSCGKEIDLLDLRWYARLITHAIVHIDFKHLQGNIINIILVGPAAERRFGSTCVLRMTFSAAVASALAFIAFGPANSRQLGLSGIVFGLILLNSLAGRAQIRGLPLTFIAVVFIWLGGDLLPKSSTSDQPVSTIAHFTGAAVGTLVGFSFTLPPQRRRGFFASFFSNRSRSASIESKTSILLWWPPPSNTLR